MIIPLRSHKALQERYSGGKAARLAELFRKGLPVPDGFIIAASWHRRLFPSPPISSAMPSRSVFSARLRSRDRQSIVKAFRRLNGPVSVRSSMIGEDSAARSYAGQLQTVLNVTGEEDLIEAIRRCYASVEQGPFRHYSGSFSNAGRSHLGVLAVLVQRMVPSRVAGVAFSVDPATRKRCIIVEATPGMGDKLVSGRVVPERYIVDTRKFEVRRDVTSTRKALLDQEQIRQLVDLVERIHGHMGSPQDIEWAWDGSRFWVLQSRPITTLHRQHFFSNQLVSDMIPGLIKPLLWSTNIADMQENVFGRIFRSLLGRGQIDPTALVRQFHSRIYADMTLFGELLKRLGLPANFFEMVTHDEATGGGRPRLTWRLMVSMPKILLFIARYGRISGRARRFIKLHDGRLDRLRDQDWSARSPEELLSRSLKLRRDHGRTQWYMWITALNMMVRRKLLSRFLERHSPEVTSQQLLTGLVGLKSLEPNQGLKRMASRARGLPSADQRALLDGDDGAIRSRLARTPAGRELLAEFDDFMRRHGFLSSRGTDFTVSSWNEHPDLIWKGIGRLMASGADGGEPDADAVRQRAHQRVRSRLGFPRGWLFLSLLGSTREYVQLRERISLFMSEDVAHMRRLYLAIGERLVMEDRLSQPEDIFYLAFQELASLIGGSANEDLLRQQISARKMALESDAAVDLEDVFYGEPRPWHPPSGHAPGPYLEGIVGSLGLAQGYAKIVNDPGEIGASLSKRDILVVPHTDVGWTPLFPSIAGIVAETGGQLSHSAIIAREYGLPAVVSVRKATRIIRDGQPITLDGDNGRVYLEHIRTEKETER